MPGHVVPITPQQNRPLEPPSSAGQTSRASSSSILSRAGRRTPQSRELLSSARFATPPGILPMALGRTPEEISASYERWMKLAADNKINASNSWNLGLIDYFFDMRILRNGDSIDFLKASCTLDGCVKIYTTRVESVAAETERLVHGLNSSGSNNDCNTEGASALDGDEDGEQHDGGTESSANRRAIKRAHAKTLEKDFAAITLKSYELEFMVDPLFRKTSADFDEGGARGLLFNHLQVHSQGQLIFDSADATLAGEPVQRLELGGDTNNLLLDASLASVDGFESPKDIEMADEEQMVIAEDENGDDLVDCSAWLGTKFSAEAVFEKSICPSLEKFVFSNKPQNYEEVMQNMQLHLLSDDLGQEEDEVHLAPAPSTAAPENDSGPPENDYVDFFVPNLEGNENDNDTAGTDDGDGFTDSNTYADGNQNGPEEPAQSAVAGKTPAEVENDPFELLPLPRPVQKPISQSTTAKVAGQRRVRQPFSIDFYAHPDVDPETLFATGVASINLPRGDHVAEDHNQLKDIEEFDFAKISLVFIKPAFQAARIVQINARGEDHDDDSNMILAAHAQDAAEREGAAADWAFEAPVGDDDFEEDNAFERGGLDGDNPDPFNFGFDAPSAMLVAPLSATGGASQAFGGRLSRFRLDIAKRSKQVDIKRLKENIWRHLRSERNTAAEPMSEDGMLIPAVEKIASRVSTTRSAPPLQFQSVLDALAGDYSEGQIKDISVPFCFICLLHLANEKNLRIEQHPELGILVFAESVA